MFVIPLGTDSVNLPSSAPSKGVGDAVFTVWILPVKFVPSIKLPEEGTCNKKGSFPKDSEQLAIPSLSISKSILSGIPSSS